MNSEKATIQPSHQWIYRFIKPLQLAWREILLIVEGSLKNANLEVP